MAHRRRARGKKLAIERELAEVECAFCRGTGRDPFGIMSHLSNCSVCGGKGVVKVRNPMLPAVPAMAQVFSPLPGLPALPAVAKA